MSYLEDALDSIRRKNKAHEAAKLAAGNTLSGLPPELGGGASPEQLSPDLQRLLAATSDQSEPVPPAAMADLRDVDSLLAAMDEAAGTGAPTAADVRDEHTQLADELLAADEQAAEITAPPPERLARRDLPQGTLAEAAGVAEGGSAASILGRRAAEDVLSSRSVRDLFAADLAARAPERFRAENQPDRGLSLQEILDVPLSEGQRQDVLANRDPEITAEKQAASDAYVPPEAMSEMDALTEVQRKDGGTVYADDPRVQSAIAAGKRVAGSAVPPPPAEAAPAPQKIPVAGAPPPPPPVQTKVRTKTPTATKSRTPDGVPRIPTGQELLDAIEAKIQAKRRRAK